MLPSASTIAVALTHDQQIQCSQLLATTIVTELKQQEASVNICLLAASNLLEE
jgi:hypothetical protein